MAGCSDGGAFRRCSISVFILLFNILKNCLFAVFIFSIFRCFLSFTLCLFWWCCYYINYNIISVWRCCFYIFRVGGGFLLLHRGGGSCRCYFYKNFTLFCRLYYLCCFLFFIILYILYYINIVFLCKILVFIHSQKIFLICRLVGGGVYLLQVVFKLF